MSCNAAGTVGSALLLRLLLLSLLAATFTAVPLTCSALHLSPPSTVIFTVSQSGAAVSCTVQLRALLPVVPHTAATSAAAWQSVWESGSIATPTAVVYSAVDAHTRCRHQAVLRCTADASSVPSATCVYPRHGYFFSPLPQPLSGPLHFHVAAQDLHDGGSCLWSDSETDVEGVCPLQDSQSDDRLQTPSCPALSNRSRPLSSAPLNRSRAVQAARHKGDETSQREGRLHRVTLHQRAAGAVRWLLLVCLLCVLHALAVLRLMHSCTTRIEAVRAV